MRQIKQDSSHFLLLEMNFTGSLFLYSIIQSLNVIINRHFDLITGANFSVYKDFACVKTLKQSRAHPFSGTQLADLKTH